ncbi:uncharacterized protein LOC106384147 [Brassica napus]|uniref:uncharacterized protein LOC106330097 n=1 Tax=Brassica oleracea var. oleracea TaxID=109376 RepID=UPI0006A6B434|nr:PREDICTED: uncharacterized protein LOC106330097 [Brassica oleracea var. oleracea]XP_013679612.1 uncharacterized protein LOC106384147 [Brassica napus]
MKHPDLIPERIDGKAGGARNTNLTTKPLYPRESNPSATKTFHQAGFDNPSEQARRHDLRGPVNIDPQREDLGILNETGTFQNYIERNDAELKRIHAIVHMVTSSTPDIDMVIEETRTNPFTNIIASVRLHHVGKLKFPEYTGSTYPKTHVRAFRLAISRAHLTSDEKEAEYCRFFAENLTGAALEWFAGLEENSIDNFTQLVSAFLKQYSAFVETRVTVADIWNLKQAPFEPLRAYINKFREMKANISHPNEVVALVALKNGVWFSSKFREELAVRAPNSLHDALHQASYFATHKEEVATLKEQYSANKNNATKKPATPKEPTTKGQHSYAINNSTQKSSTYDLSKYCAFQDRKGHSTEECRSALCNQNKNKKTNEEVGEEEEPVTPKSNRKAKATTNKRGREVEHESPNSSPPASKKRIYMISREQNSSATDEIKNQTEGKICFEISLVIRALENPDEVTPPPLHHSIQPKNKTS